MAQPLHLYECASDQRPMTLKIERISGKRRTRIRLSGAFRSEHLDQVKAEIERGGPQVALDLEEVDLVDVEGVRFLNACEAEGISVLHCSPYIREWMLRERESAKSTDINVRRNRLFWRMKMASTYRTVEASAAGRIVARQRLSKRGAAKTKGPVAWLRDKRGEMRRSPVVLITGALTGIGRAAAMIFAQEGAQIVVSGRRDKEGQELVAELQKLGAEAIFVRTDVRRMRTSATLWIKRSSVSDTWILQSITPDRRRARTCDGTTAESVAAPSTPMCSARC